MPTVGVEGGIPSTPTTTALSSCSPSAESTSMTTPSDQTALAADPGEEGFKSGSQPFVLVPLSPQKADARTPWPRKKPKTLQAWLGARPARTTARIDRADLAPSASRAQATPPSAGRKSRTSLPGPAKAARTSRPSLDAKPTRGRASLGKGRASTSSRKSIPSKRSRPRAGYDDSDYDDAADSDDDFQAEEDDNDDDFYASDSQASADAADEASMDVDDSDEDFGESQPKRKAGKKGGSAKATSAPRMSGGASGSGVKGAGAAVKGWRPGFRKDAPFQRLPWVPTHARAVEMEKAAIQKQKQGALPPIHDLADIFADIVRNIDRGAMLKLCNTLRGRPLRAATMCSGTESPLLALRLISRACERLLGVPLDVEHVFSCEIEPYKQAYIERNFSPPLLFRDVCELGNDRAHTAYGALVDVPGDVDLLVAGTSCVDYSGLNNKKKGMEDGGESGRTFFGMLNWVKRHRPAVVILENVKTAPWSGVAQYFVDAGYDAAYSNTFDTKHYYIPHTRQRGYLVATRRRDGCYAENWEALTRSLVRPASSPIEDFLLPADDPRIQQVRREFALGEGFAGRSVIDWSRCQGRHERARDEEELGKGRPFTAWEEGGSCKLSHDAWNEWALPMPERVLDLLDITVLRSAKENVDPHYKSRIWELSQNVDRNIASAAPGISGCLTPSGMPYHTGRGGPISGREALALQGLPTDELLLSRETNDQLQNLAGNAMSSTVVGVCTLAALVIAQPDLHETRSRGADKAQGGDTAPLDPKEDTSAVAKPALRRVESDVVERPYDLEACEPCALRPTLEQAIASSQLCRCEGRTLTTAEAIYRCRDCGHTACASCRGRPEHNYEEARCDRTDPAEFGATLKTHLPMRLRLGGVDVASLNAAAVGVRGLDSALYATWASRVAEVLSDAELRFSELLRQRYWRACYRGPSAKLELCLDPAQPHWRLFVEPARDEPAGSELRRLLLRPVARLALDATSEEAAPLLPARGWELCLPSAETFSVEVALRGELVPTWQASLGLGGKFADTKRYSVAEVKMSGSVETDAPIEGTYELMPNCGTPCNSLFIRRDDAAGAEDTPTAAPLRQKTFFFIDTHRFRGADADHYVFSTEIERLAYPLERVVLARAPAGWRLPLPSKSPPAAEVHEKVRLTMGGRWVALRELGVSKTRTAHRATFGVPSRPPRVRADEEDACLCSHVVVDASAHVAALEDNGVWPLRRGEWDEVDLEHKSTTVFKTINWLMERVALPELLCGEGGTTTAKGWIAGGKVVRSRTCATCAPAQPDIKWLQVPGRQPMPTEDERQAAPYEQALKNRPPPFVMQLRVDEAEGVATGGGGGREGVAAALAARARIAINAATLMHRALSRLPRRDDCDVEVELGWRLSRLDKSLDMFNLPAYTLRSNRRDAEAEDPRSFRLPLRREQRRSLSWMLAQERTPEPFWEEEVSEGLLEPLGWRAEGKASRKVVVRGGVLADAVGYGKTAITLGLVAAQKQASREAGEAIAGAPAERSDLIPTKATLVIVPPHLCKQWAGEVEKFTGSKLKVLVVHSKQELNQLTIADVCRVDLVIMSVTLYKSDAYFDSLARLAAANPLPTKAGRYFDAALDKTVAALAKRMHELTNEGAAKVWESVKARVDFDPQHLTTYKPTKRLVGQAYADAKAKADARGEDGGQDDDAEAQEAARVTKPAPVADSWGLKSASVRRDYRMMSAPPLECFRWERVVVDEFHYIAENADRAFAAIPRLHAKAKWVLSGTPPTADFADIKLIAAFLSVHLGVDDDADSAKASVRSRREKQRTLVERFRNFVEVRSPAWHHRRQAVAQTFLDRFVRQNVAEIDEIPFEERFRPVSMPAAERACYLELAHTIEALDLRLARRIFRAGAGAAAKRAAAADGHNDREERLRKTLGESASPEEALSRQAAHFVLGDGTASTAAEACDFIVEERRRQRDECLKQLEREIKAARAQHFVVLLQHGFRDEANQALVTFSRNVEKGAWGDDVSKPVLSRLLEALKCTAKGLSREAGRKDFPQLKPKTKAKEQDAKEAAWEEEYKLRGMVHLLQRLRNEYASREQSLRYFTQVRDIQLANSRGETLELRCPSAKCDKAGRTLDMAQLALVSTCGHVGCYDCLLQNAYIGQCSTPECHALSKPTSVVRASTLGAEHGARAATAYGMKLAQVATVLKRRIPPSERVLLFVQFEGLLAKVAQALRRYGVPFVRLEGSASRRSEQLSAFQNGEAGRVLLLNVADESAAGSNLTVANHVIFLSPLVAEEAQQYHATMQQAKGRAIRFGQTRQVHIWRFVALDTIDQTTLEAREARGAVEGEAMESDVEDVVDDDYDAEEDDDEGEIDGVKGYGRRMGTKRRSSGKPAVATAGRGATRRASAKRKSLRESDLEEGGDEEGQDADVAMADDDDDE